MSYKKNKYAIIRNAIPLSVADFVHDYFVNKKQVQKILEDTGYISQFNSDWGKVMTNAQINIVIMVI